MTLSFDYYFKAYAFISKFDYKRRTSGLLSRNCGMVKSVELWRGEGGILSLIVNPTRWYNTRPILYCTRLFFADDKQQPKRENRHLSTPNQAAPPLLQLKVLGKPKPLLTDSWSASKGCVSSFFSSTTLFY